MLMSAGASLPETIEELFQISGADGGYYDPSDLTTLYQDAAGTTPADTDGDPVRLVQDKSGNGNDLTAPAGAPALRQDGSGDWYLEFTGPDGNSAYLITSAGILPVGTAIAAARIYADGNDALLTSRYGNGSIQLVWGLGLSGTAAGWQTNVDILWSNRATTDAINEGATRVYSAEAAPAETLDEFLVCYDRAQFDKYLMADLYGLVIHGTPLIQAERAFIENELAARAGVTL
ncbi:MAG: hypothetical protein RLO11_00220 [Salinisphaeraceae bacterium]